MDRQIVYVGAIPQDVDQLKQNKNSMIGLGYALQAILGTNTLVDGLACNPTSPASLNVTVGPGSIYSQQNVDGTAYGSLSADTTDQIVKQGIVMSTQTFNCPAPSTSGFSVVYLVEATYEDVDGGSTVLPYYNASNPSQAYNGPNNTGVSQNTVRQGVCNIQVKTGVAATTGTQVTPTADAGYTGLYAITVANGQTTITSGNIVQLTTAPFINPKLGGFIAAIQNGTGVYVVDTSSSANTITIAPNPALTALTAGMEVRVKVANTNNGAVVMNTNGLGNVSVVAANGNPIPPAALVANGLYKFAYDGSHWQFNGQAQASADGSSANNMVISQASTTTVNITIAELILEDATGNTVRATGVSQTLTASGTGANGLDTGSLGANTFYYVFEIFNPSTNTVASLASITAPNANGTYAGAHFPTGYTFSRIISCFLTDGSSHIGYYYQVGRRIFQTGLLVFSGKTPQVSTLTSQSIAAVVPPIAKTVFGEFDSVPFSGVNNHLQVAADSSGTGLREGPITTSSTVTNLGNILLNFEVPLITSQTVFINFSNTATGNGNNFVINGYTF